VTRQARPKSSILLAGALGLACGTGLNAQDALGGDPVPLDLLLSIGSWVGGETPIWSPDGTQIAFASSLGGQAGVWAVSPDGGFPEQLIERLGGVGFLSSRNLRWSPDGQHLSYVSERDGKTEIWLWSRQGGAERQLTSLGGRINFSSWSPDSRTIAFSSNVMGQFDIWTVDVASGQMRRITRDTRYEVNPAWTPDGQTILYVRLDERWADHDVMAIAASGGDSRVVVEDRDFFDYGYGRTFGPALPSPDGREILFRSHRNGWINYWRVPLSGGEPIPLAAQDADQSDAVWSPDGRSVAFSSNLNGTFRLQVASVSTGEVRTLVAPTMGMATAPSWSPDGTEIAFYLGSPTSPVDLHVVTVDRGEVRPLTRSMPGGDVASRLIAPEKIVYPSTDGYEIPAYVYSPAASPAEVRHPALIWVHGGPTSQFSDSFQQQVQFFVQRGYVVLMPNIRGSSGYGKDFEDANNGCWGHCDLEDILAGVDWLKAQPFVDGDRLGITGASYGGIMSMTAVAFAPGVFQAAAPQSGYGDWVAFFEDEDNEIRHIKLLEYEFGPWPESRDALKRSSAIYAVSDIQTPVFLIQGEGLYPGSPQSYRFAEALQAHYKPFRHSVFQGENYYVSGRANRRVMLQEMLDFFGQYLAQ
jgi:dipeptidyl aminopeptidase/acylaminoacyl peptidase